MTKWITAAEALKAVQGDDRFPDDAIRALISRAQVGMIAVKAERIAYGDIIREDADIDRSFWWTTDPYEYHFDWKRGDFETYIDWSSDFENKWRGDELEVRVSLFGVKFASEFILDCPTELASHDAPSTKSPVSDDALKKFYAEFVAANEGRNFGEDALCEVLQSYFIGRSVTRQRIRILLEGRNKVGRPSKVAEIESAK